MSFFKMWTMSFLHLSGTHSGTGKVFWVPIPLSMCNAILHFLLTEVWKLKSFSVDTNFRLTRLCIIGILIAISVIQKMPVGMFEDRQGIYSPFYPLSKLSWLWWPGMVSSHTYAFPLKLILPTRLIRPVGLLPWRSFEYVIDKANGVWILALVKLAGLDFIKADIALAIVAFYFIIYLAGWMQPSHSSPRMPPVLWSWTLRSISLWISQ